MGGGGGSGGGGGGGGGGELEDVCLITKRRTVTISVSVHEYSMAIHGLYMASRRCWFNPVFDCGFNWYACPVARQ